jgi:hypothetical protein
MVAPAVEGIDLFKIAGRAIAGWIPSFKMGAASHVSQRRAVALVASNATACSPLCLP